MKRIASGLLAILTFALVFPAGAFAQNTMTVQNASGDPGDTGVVVRIELANDTDVAGLQFILTDETGDLTPQSVRAGPRLSGLFPVSDYFRIVNDVDGNIGKDEVHIIGINLELDPLLVGSGVIVNCVTPGTTRTEVLGEISEEYWHYQLSKIPLGRLGRVEETAHMVGWLCSEDCSFSTGAVFDVSGGRATY